MNDLLEYNTNTNAVTRGKGTKLICSSSFEQFNQEVSEKLASPRLGWLKGSYETNKGMRNETQTTLKWNQIELEANPKN
jgi:hypothetical protein